jgi:hypothetical protein
MSSASEPPRKQIYFYGAKALGMNEENMVEVLRDLDARGKQAKEQGFVIEAIAIRAYLVEFWLRAHIVHHTGKPHTPGLTLGRVVDRAEDCHLSDEVVEKLRSFVKHRNTAIHRLLEGKKRYDDMWEVFREAETLVNEVADEVIEKLIAGATVDPSPDW